MSQSRQGPPARRPDAPSEGRRGRLHLARRASWNLVDQVLSALTNMVLAVLVVHAAGSRAFDAFAVSFLLFSIMIGIERALVAQPLLVRHSHDTGAERRHTVSRAGGLVLGFTVPAAAIMLAAGLLLGGQLGSTLVATAVVLPFLILQDACRHAFFAGGEAKKAAFNDALWALIQFSAMGLITAAGAATAPNLVLAWGGAAAVCVVVALVQLRAVPNPLATISWIGQHRDQVGYLLGEYMLSTGAFNGGYLAVGALLGSTEAVGSIRAAQVLLGPLQIVSGAVLSFGLPELSRRTDAMKNRQRRKIAVLVTAAMATMSLGYTGILLLLPDLLGELMFQGKWYESQPVLLPLGLAMIVSTAALGPALVIYALGKANKTFRIMTIEAPLVFGLLTGGTLLSGVEGAAWGQFITQAIVVVLFYRTLQQVLRGRRRIPAVRAPLPDFLSSAREHARPLDGNGAHGRVAPQQVPGR